MEDEFDKIARELIGQKKYSFDQSLWVKTKIGVKAAYTKIIVVKSAIALSTVGMVATMGTIVYNQLSEPTINNALETPQVKAIELATKPEVDKSSLDLWALHSESAALESTVKSEDLTIRKTVEAQSTQVSNDASTQIINHVQGKTNHKVQEQLPLQQQTSTSVIKVPNQLTSSACTTTSPQAGSGPSEVYVRTPFDNIQALPRYTKPVSSEFAPLALIPFAPIVSKGTLWSAELYLTDGTPRIREKSPNTTYREGLSSSEGKGLDVYYNLSENWRIGSGVKLQTLNETLYFDEMKYNVTSRSEGGFRIDSFFIGPGFVYNEILQQWENTDSAYHYELVSFTEMVYDTTWKTETRKVSNMIKTVEIPFHVAYEFKARQFSFRPSLSISGGYIYGSSYAQKSGPNQSIVYVENPDINALFINLGAEADVLYRLTNRNYINVGMGYSNSLFSSTGGSFDYNNSNYPVGTGPLSIAFKQLYYKVGIGTRF